MSLLRGAYSTKLITISNLVSFLTRCLTRENEIFIILLISFHFQAHLISREWDFILNELSRARVISNTRCGSEYSWLLPFFISIHVIISQLVTQNAKWSQCNNGLDSMMSSSCIFIQGEEFLETFLASLYSIMLENY